MSSRRRLLHDHNRGNHALVRPRHFDLDQPAKSIVVHHVRTQGNGATMAEPSQQPVIDFLASPAAHGGHAVARIDTHAASVFLSGSRALKIKRAVRFPFLDFSTLEKRRKACEAEIAINRAYAPGIYRGVVPITREQNGALSVGGKGQPVEWAVDMRRFDESQTLDHVVEAGAI